MKHCPRIVRIGLNPSVAFSLEPAALAQEIVQRQPAFKRQADTWLRMATAKTSRDRPWPDMQNAHRQTGRLVEGLDTLARENPALEELADCLLLMTAASTELKLASRLAHRLWQSLGQLGEFRSLLSSAAPLLLPERVGCAHRFKTPSKGSCRHYREAAKRDRSTRPRDGGGRLIQKGGVAD